MSDLWIRLGTYFSWRFGSKKSSLPLAYFNIQSKFSKYFRNFYLHLLKPTLLNILPLIKKIPTFGQFPRAGSSKSYGAIVSWNDDHKEKGVKKQTSSLSVLHLHQLPSLWYFPFLNWCFISAPILLGISIKYCIPKRQISDCLSNAYYHLAAQLWVVRICIK